MKLVIFYIQASYVYYLGDARIKRVASQTLSSSIA